MSLIQNRKLASIVFFYISVLYLGISLFDVYAYGYAISLVSGLLIFITNSPRNNFENLLLSLTLLIPIQLYTDSSWVYFALSVTNVYCILSIFDIYPNLNLSNAQYKFINRIFAFYVALFFILMLDPSRFSDSGRYIGLLPSNTVSSSVLFFIIIYLLEYYRETDNNKLVYYICILIFFIVLLICKARSVLFVAPYFLYYYYKLTTNKRNSVIAIVSTVVLLCGLVYFLSINAEGLRLSKGESSALSRMYFYEMEFDGIKDAHFVLPHGFNSCTEMIQDEAGEDYSPHNDLLAYWYDWGGIWIFFLIVFYRKFRKVGKLYNEKFRLLTISIFWLSCALHNILLSMLIWIPMLLIMIQLKNNSFKQSPYKYGK